MSDVNTVKEELKGLSETILGLKTSSFKKEGRDKLTGLKRLLKLANHGIYGKQVQDVFDIGHFHEKTNCDTSGCMIGECPGVFKEWKWDEYDMPILKDLQGNFLNKSERSSMEFFDLNKDEFGHLFCDNEQDEDFYYKKNIVLEKACSKKQVAENMLDFIQYKIRDTNDSINGD